MCTMWHSIWIQRKSRISGICSLLTFSICYNKRYPIRSTSPPTLLTNSHRNDPKQWPPFIVWAFEVGGWEAILDLGKIPHPKELCHPPTFWHALSFGFTIGLCMTIICMICLTYYVLLSLSSFQCVHIWGTLVFFSLRCNVAERRGSSG